MQDYYAFGMQMPGRKLSGGYRYGFNGKENDNEVKGEGNQQDYGWRIHDPRIGRFLSTDPISKDYPELTPYQYASNTPIQAIDLDGLEAAGVGFGWGTSQLQSTEARDQVAKGMTAMGKGFLHSAWSSLKSLATLTSPVPTPEKMLQTAAIYQAVTNPGQAYREIKKELKQWGSNLASKDPAVSGYALGQGLEFGAEFLIPIPLAKGAAGTRVAGRTAEIESAFLGGAKRDLLSKKNILEGNHLPTMGGIKQAGFDISFGEGSAMQMLYKEHQSFISSGNSKAAQAFRKKEASLLKDGKFMEAFDLNSERLISSYGNKYKSAIKDARDYYQKEIIPKLEKQLTEQKK
ncbi:MAG: RHS repeat-associated core domain-containing protein [Sediminibacterium sp.]|nr:RHS repeat-associated core domain-containing protein [Sediminibacterium sp.]